MMQEEKIERLLRQIESSDIAERVNAKQKVLRLKPAERDELFKRQSLRQLESGDMDARCEAAEHLRAYEDQRVIEALLRCLENMSPPERVWNGDDWEEVQS